MSVEQENERVLFLLGFGAKGRKIMVTDEHIIREILIMLDKVYPQSECFSSIMTRLSEKYAPQEIRWKSIIAELEEGNRIERTKGEKTEGSFTKITLEGKDTLKRMLREQE